jgi:Concanavalin A-like lectin/glucanases superfamily
MPTKSNASTRRASLLSLTALSALFCALAFLCATSGTAAAQASPVTYWDQPALVNPTTIAVSDTNRTLNLQSTQDYIVECPTGAVQLSGKLTVWGGHNVVFQNCNEDVTNPTGDWAADFQNQTGTLWIHDVHFGGAHLTGGIQLQEPGATVVLRDVLFDQVNGSYSTNHAECIQTWSGPDRFLIDGLTCNTTYQGLFLQPNQYGGATPTVWDFRNVDIYGQGAYDLWLADVGPGQVGQLPDFTVQNAYDCDPTSPRTMDGTTDGGTAWASVRGCPTPSAGQFAQATPSGATGPDEADDPQTSDVNEFVDPQRYAETINADTPQLYLSLNSGTSVAGAASAGAQPAATTATYGPGVTLGVPGPVAGSPDTAVALGSSGAQIQTTQSHAAPNQYTVEAWFSAQSGSGGGQIVGMNQSENGSAQNDDHSVYLNSGGQVVCYYYSAGKHELVSPGSYTDGRWHLVQCAKGSGGMTLDVDGTLVASNTFTGPAFPYSGYWVIGDRHAGDGAQQSIIGDVAQVATYGYALSQAQDADHWAVGQGQPATGS